jgi:AcrR family transcriptional regulator
MVANEKAQRADAQQNRLQLMEIARDAFIASGEISMTALAKRAGVGVGTLYRHFPTREALVIAVYQQEIQTLAELAGKLLETHPPYLAVRLWFDRLAYYGRMKYGVAAIVHGATSVGAEREAYNLVIGAINELLTAGADAGVLKPDLDADDVLLIVAFLWRIPSVGDVEARAARMLDLVMDGLSPVTSLE